MRNISLNQAIQQLSELKAMCSNASDASKPADILPAILRLEQLLDDASNYQNQQQMVIDSTGVGIWDWDVQTGETEFNHRWAEIIGYRLEELKPVSIQTWLQFAHDDDLQTSQQKLEATWRGDCEIYSHESRMHHKDGSLVWVLDTGKVVEWLEPGVPKRMIGTHLDITQLKQHNELLDAARAQAESALHQLSDMNLQLQTEVARRKQAEEAIRRKALLDHLTQLPNRLALEEYFLHSAKQGGTDTRMAVIFIDLDNFKQLDTECGHPIGDAVLVELSIILQEVTHNRGMCGRIAGDDFAIIVPDVQSNAPITQLLDELVRRFPDELTAVDSRYVQIRAGVCFYPDHGANFTDLNHFAEAAMLKADHSQRGTYHFFEPSQDLPA